MLRGVSRAAGLGIAWLALAGCAGPELPSAPQGQAAACPRQAAPRYDVIVNLPEPERDDRLSLAEISAHSQAAFRHLTLGETESRLQISAVFSARVAPGALGGVCLYIARAAFSLGFSQRVIHIAREFRGAESCLYDTVLDHERRHVALDDRIIEAAAQRLRADPPEQFATLNGVWGANEAEARAETQGHLNLATEALQRQIQRERQVAHALQIDTVDERRRMLAACNGRLTELHPEFR